MGLVMYLEVMNMSIKKQWLITLIMIALIAIVINSSLYGLLIDKFFVGYIEENYSNQVEEIQEYSKYILQNHSVSKEQIKMEMQKYLDDPISEIHLYYPNGQKIIEAKGTGMGMMGGRMMHGDIREERDEYNINDEEVIIGKLVITRQGSVQSSATSIIFKNVLFTNSLISGVIVLFIAIIVSILISKRTAKDMIDTANYAKALDISKQMEIQYSTITEIKEIQNSLILLSTKLKLKEKSRKQKLDTMAHQARTPLTIIKSHLEAAKDGIVIMDENRLESCINQVDNLTNMIYNLNEFVDIEQESQPLKIETFDYVEEIKRIIKGFKIQFENRNIQLTLSGLNSVLISTDKYLLTQGIYNILTNAYKFTQDGGRVELNIQNMDGNIVLKIEDNGMGIPKESLPKIFNAYTRSSNAMKIPGQGLGLFILSNNIERIGGKVEVFSELRKGTIFQISIPNADEG